jgi:hypothetical protein
MAHITEGYLKRSEAVMREISLKLFNGGECLAQPQATCDVSTQLDVYGGRRYSQGEVDFGTCSKDHGI